MRHVLTLVLLAASALPAQIRTTELAASVTIEDAIATTELKLVVHNDGDRIAEADWVLPLPPGAVADGFVMEVGGKRLDSEVLDASRARATYERIVRARRDPALLEYAGRDCLRARIFPIPARGDVSVTVRFRQVLPSIDRLLEWRLPLRAAGAAGARPEHCVLDLRLKSQHAIRNVFTSTPGVHVARHGECEARVSFEGATAQLGPDADVQLYYGLSEEDFGVDVLSFKRGSEAGYFMMLVAPDLDAEDVAPSPRTMTFVIDTSGSMQGVKIDQARTALQFFVRSLRPIDHFNVVPFSTEAMPFFEAPVAAHPTNVDVAIAKIDQLQANGGTNIGDALARGIARPAHPDSTPITVFLTDGQPTVGERGSAQLCSLARQTAKGVARVFVFGVGDKVNTHLLDAIAADNGGTRQYVRPSENIELKTSDLLRKIQHPVLTSIEIEVDGATITRQVPRRLPDLFRGSRLAIVGRYEHGGAHDVRLRGQWNGETKEFHYERTFTKASTDRDFIPSLWAERRIGALLDELRLHGDSQELLDEVSTLGREFQIVTPYTSHLILEEGLQVSRAPGGAGGSSAGPSGPTTPGSGGPATGGGGPTTGGNYRGPGDSIPRETLIERLVASGAIPRDASEDEQARIVERIARELRRADDNLAGLSDRQTGARAVDDSAYLSRLMGDITTQSDDFYMGAGKRVERDATIASFARRIGGRIFYLRDGAWTDRQLLEPDRAEREVRDIEAFSTAYFELLRAHPKLAAILAFSDRMRILVGDLEFSIHPPAAASRPTTK